MKKLTYFLFGLVSLLSSNFCLAQVDDPVALDSLQNYEGCCGAEAVEFIHEEAYIFVPNVFTPNEDGMNDYFAPIVNDQVLEIVDYLIFSGYDSTVVFYQKQFDFNESNRYAWKGMIDDATPYKGGFRYTMLVVLKSGKLMQVEGKACRIVCEPAAQVFQTLEGCFYSTQVGQAGTLDTNLPSQESGCF